MAATRGVEVKESQTEILQKLSSNGEYLQNSTSTLLLEMNVLNKLIYKSKNTHSKEKFFKCLERIKKCLGKWKLLSLDKKVIKTSKIGETGNLIEILNEIMLGGQLAVRVIILCQETVQYNLAYLSRGFFVTFHVTLISLVSRIWVLQKDCWVDLMECYQLVRSLIPLTDHHISLNDFPECLTLCVDVEKMFDARNASVNGQFSTTCSSNTFFQQFFKEKNGSDSPIMFTESVNDDELDIGEPVEDIREFNEEVENATPKVTNEETMSYLKTNLPSKFDLGHATRKNDRENESSKMDEQRLEETNSNDSHNRKIRCKLNELGKFDNKLVVRKRRRGLYCKGSKTFIKRLPCRYTLRRLLATRDYSEFSMKIIRTLLKCLAFALHSQVLPGERKVTFRVQYLLQRELRERGHGTNRREEDKHSCLRDTREDSETSGISRKISTKIEKCGILCHEKKDILQSFVGHLKDGDRHEDFQKVRPMELRNSLFVNENLKDKESQSKWRDEIDDIFGSLGL